MMDPATDLDLDGRAVANKLGERAVTDPRLIPSLPLATLVVGGKPSVARASVSAVEQVLRRYPGDV